MSAAPAFAMMRCPRCGRELQLEQLKTDPAFICPLCSRSFELVRFETRAPEVRQPRHVGGTIEASQPCAVHARNAAVATCDRCGAFMCELCRIDVDGRTLCPGCFDRLAAGDSLESTRTTFRDYAGMAFTSALVGFVFSALFFWVAFAPLAIYYGIRALKQKKAMGETDGKILVWVSMLLAVVDIGFGLVMTAAFFR